MIYNVPFFAAAAVILIGLYSVVFKRNLIKIVIGITFIISGINLFFITLGYRDSGTIMPVSQSITLVTIIIGFAILVLMSYLVICIYKHYGTLDIRKIWGSKK